MELINNTAGKLRCSVLDCEVAVMALGVCSKHYQRLRSHGTTDLVQVRHHGAANRKNTPEYSAWVALRNRCYNRANKDYIKYGQRGISVCRRWVEGEDGVHPFQCFLADMGPKPGAGYSIDRKDVNGNYSPDNCYWATAKQQARNRRTNRLVEYMGRNLTVSEWSEISGVHVETIRHRFKRGWETGRALGMEIF